MSQESGKSVAVVVPADLLKIGKLLREQDNRGTDQPMFVVQEKREFASDPDRNDSVLTWFDNRDGEYSEVSALRAKRLTLLSNHFIRKAGYECVHVAHQWVAVTACFTENGCQAYIDANKHNHNELRIYADGSFRNFEFRAIRNWLMALPELTNEV